VEIGAVDGGLLMLLAFILLDNDIGTASESEIDVDDSVVED